MSANADVIVGLMSGTSLDGITAAAATFRDVGARVEPTLLAQAHRPFAPEERARLLDAMQGGSARDYCMLSVDLAHWLADAAELAITASGVPRSRVRAVVSHGQTLWHEPGHSTWQLGQPAVIAERLALDVISDVRARDVAAGGQGAPLVSAADVMCFSHDSEWRVLQNIGGIGNLTLVPPAGSPHAPIAFDTGPGVVIMDGVVRMLVPGLVYDVDGILASQGEPLTDVVRACLAHPYFEASPPKTTGRELFTPDYISQFIDSCRAASPAVSVADIVATAVLFTAESIADQIARFVNVPISQLVVAGGGADNPSLMKALANVLPARLGSAAPQLHAFSDLFFSGDAKEAVAFALIGWLHLQQRAGNVPSATGALGPRVLGSFTPAHATP
jgi:anhydro-N-acetylmuramic acid kinase